MPRKTECFEKAKEITRLYIERKSMQDYIISKACIEYSV